MNAYRELLQELQQEQNRRDEARELKQLLRKSHADLREIRAESGRSKARMGRLLKSLEGVKASVHGLQLEAEQVRRQESLRKLPAVMARAKDAFLKGRLSGDELRRLEATAHQVAAHLTATGRAG